MSKALTFKSYEDAGHGWLAVKRKLLLEFGLMELVSMFSYERGQTVYLEEDCDVSLFISALKQRGIEYQFKSGKWCEYSPIRSYDRFCVKAGELNPN